jgi:hypothetical protein
MDSPSAWPQQQPDPLPPGVSSVYARPSRRAAAQRRPRRALFWVFLVIQAPFAMALIGAGAQQSIDTTFGTLGSWASADVILAAGFTLWRLTAPEPEPGRQQGHWPPGVGPAASPGTAPRAG